MNFIVESFTEESPDTLSDADANVIFYVAGCLGRAVARQRKCEACKRALIADPILSSEIAEDALDHARLLQIANRGGLAKPSEYTMSVCAYGFLYFRQVTDSNVLFSKRLPSGHCRCFTLAVERFLLRDQSTAILTRFTCDSGHTVFRQIISKLFNCISGNIVTKFNSPLLPRKNDDRKLRKLQSSFNK